MAKEIKICGGAYGDKGGATLKDEKYKKEIKNKAHEVEKYRVHDKEHKERRSVECVRCWMCFSSWKSLILQVELVFTPQSKGAVSSLLNNHVHIYWLIFIYFSFGSSMFLCSLYYITNKLPSKCGISFCNHFLTLFWILELKKLNFIRWTKSFFMAENPFLNNLNFLGAISLSIS